MEHFDRRHLPSLELHLRKVHSVLTYLFGNAMGYPRIECKGLLHVFGIGSSFARAFMAFKLVQALANLWRKSQRLLGARPLRVHCHRD